MSVMYEVLASNVFFKSRVLGDAALKLSAEERLEVLDLVYLFE